MVDDQTKKAIVVARWADGMFDTKDIVNHLVFSIEAIVGSAQEIKDRDDLVNAIFQIEGISKAIAYIHVVHDTIEEQYRKEVPGCV